MTRESIMEAAETLFTKKGFSATSLADVAAAAGISRGTLFYHFRSKDDLILEIALVHIDRVSGEILAVLHGGGDPPDIRHLLERFIREVLSSSLRNNLHLYLIEEGLSSNPRLKEALSLTYGKWKDTMAGILRPSVGERADELAAVFIALLDGFIIQKSLEQPVPALEGVIGALLGG